MAGAGNAMGVLVDALSNLQDVANTAEFSLPKIAVFGGQSAGKSSVIESLVGKTFLPRGTGIKTHLCEDAPGSSWQHRVHPLQDGQQPSG